MYEECPHLHSESIRVFNVSRFRSEFPQFADTTAFPENSIARYGRMAQRYITEWRCGFPLSDPDDREYATFLMAAHIASLRKNADDEMSGGSLPAGGRVRKATVGAVTVETDSPHTYNSDDYTYWLSQTTFGQELLAFLANAAPAGIFLNCPRDTVRVLR